MVLCWAIIRAPLARTLRQRVTCDSTVSRGAAGIYDADRNLTRKLPLPLRFRLAGMTRFGSVDAPPGYRGIPASGNASGPLVVEGLCHGNYEGRNAVCNRR